MEVRDLEGSPAFDPDEPIRIGVSRCLLGEEVRYDGGHKRDRYLTDVLSRYFQFVPVCPEVEAGMPTPREAIRLVDEDGDLRLRGQRSEDDHTVAMRAYVARRVPELGSEDLCGFVAKSKSPSCGVHRVKVYGTRGSPNSKGRGLFAAGLVEANPLLPVEEEGRLCDPRLRENWIERVFAYRELRRLFRPNWTMGHVVAFHSRFKLTLMAHSPEHYRSLGRLVGSGKPADRAGFRDTYQSEFMTALGRIATPRKHANVLQHMLGYMKGKVEDDTRQEIHRLIHDYRTGVVPLIVPITLIGHYVRKIPVPYLQQQSYLEPHPWELALRNHV